MKLNVTPTKQNRPKNFDMDRKNCLIKLEKLDFIHGVIKNLIDINKSVLKTLPNKRSQANSHSPKTYLGGKNKLLAARDSRLIYGKGPLQRFEKVEADFNFKIGFTDNFSECLCSYYAQSSTKFITVTKNISFKQSGPNTNHLFHTVALLDESVLRFDTSPIAVLPVVISSEYATGYGHYTGSTLKSKNDKTRVSRSTCSKPFRSAKRFDLRIVEKTFDDNTFKTFTFSPEWQFARLKSTKLTNPAQRRQTIDAGEISIRLKYSKFVPRWRKIEGEEEAAEADEVSHAKPRKRPSHRKDDEQPEVKEMSEAEKALMAQKKKHEADDAEKLKEYEEQRRIQRERDEEELRLLKEKQERRRQEREEEDRIMMERRREDEDRRKAEEEQRKAKAENEKKRKEEDKRKKQAMMAGLQATGPNFELPKRDPNQEKFDKFGNIMKAKAEMGETKQQHEEQKKKHLAELLKPLEYSGLDVSALKAKVKEMHKRICKLEALKYDLEQRQVRQDYDLKEMNERQRQISRNKALKKGIDPEEAATSRHPPKVPVSSKYDRQIDRRSYGDRRGLFESPKTSKGKPIFHGSARPPDQWGRRTNNEELENIRKNLEAPKYVETVKLEGARPPMEPIPVQMPAEIPVDEED